MELAMKRNIAWIILLVMLLSVFAGCKKKGTTQSTKDDVAETSNINDAIAYLKSFYRDDGGKTPVDYDRFGIVRIAGIPFEVVWTADVSDELIKVIVNDNGITTIDVNEQCETDTPYVLTATITAENGEKVSHSWNYILPAAMDMVSIVKAAYALASGDSLPFASTLTGRVISINTPYDDTYKNITVTIEIAGAEDMPILCYRLGGDGVRDIKIGDTITVTGTLKNHNGIIEFDAGCNLDTLVSDEHIEVPYDPKQSVDETESPTEPKQKVDENPTDPEQNVDEVPSDPKQIVDEAYALGVNKSLKYEATLTGTIMKVVTAYDAVYNNITVTMAVAGRESKPIVCYRMKGRDVSKIDIGDTITVKGYIKNYVGDSFYSTIEFDEPTLVSYKKNPNVVPTNPVDIVKAAYALKPGTQLPYKATLTGKILNINDAYSADYGNITVTIEVVGAENMPIKCYRLNGADVDKIGLGDTITVSGYMENFQHSSGDTEVEFVFGCVMTDWRNTGEDIPVTTTPPLAGEDPPVTTTPPVTDEGPPATTKPPVIDEEVPTTTKPSVSGEYVKNPVSGTMYYMGMNNGSMMYFNGKTESVSITHRLAATENVDEAVRVKLESVSGGYLMYFMNGETKTYIRIYERLTGDAGKGKGSLELVTTAPMEVLVFDSTLNTLVYKADEKNSYYLGTYDAYTTFSVSNTAAITGNHASMMDVSQYPARLYPG